MNGCDFEQKNVPLVPGGVKLILTFPENWVQTFPLYLEKQKDVKSTTYGKFSRGQDSRVLYTPSGVFCNVPRLLYSTECVQCSTGS